MIILQWNVRSFRAISHGFKGFIRDCRRTLDILCIHGTWLKPMLDCVISGYASDGKIEERVMEEDI